ncbi:MAG: DEDD exonuclease domain-containing protein [Nitriliruptoraceae bacterium]
MPTLIGTPSHQPTFDDLGTPLIDTTFVVVDLETTGLDPRRDRITEIGAVRVRGGDVEREFSTFVHPGRPIPAAITALTGITDAMVRNAPRIDDVLDHFRPFVAGAVFVAHNARFDHGFLATAFARAGLPEFGPVVIDTARLARRLLRDEVRNVRLSTLAGHLGARTRPAHRALADARATVDVLHALLERAGSLGATSLEELRDLTRSRSDRRFRRIQLVRDAPRTCGVYQFEAHDGEILYVGKATDLRSRLRTYFGQDERRSIDQMIRETHRVRWTVTPTLLDAEIRELRAIQAHLPRYNRASTRPTPPVYIALTDEAMPRLSIVREESRHPRRTIGPLASRGEARRVVEALEAVTDIRTCRVRLRRRQDHPACVLKSIGRCAAPCDGTQSIEDYAETVAALERALDAPDELLAVLRSRMHELAAQRRFEHAAEARAQLYAVASALHRHRRVEQLRDAGRLVIAWDYPDHREVVVIDRGTYVSSHRIDRDIQQPALFDGGAVDRAQRSQDPVAETSCLLRALERPDARVLESDGDFASVLAGGRTISEHVREAKRVARTIRADTLATSAA